MSKAVNEYNKLGIVFAFIGVLLLFSFLNHNSTDFWSNTKINMSTIEKTLANDGSTGNYNQETLALIGLWIILMIIGSYLLIHIHFKVLSKERQ